jgi:hypothetical protein
VKELETHSAEYAAKGHYALTGSACMSGPFDLSDQARLDIIKPQAAFDLSFFLPYLLQGYHAVYGPRMDLRAAYAPILLEEREDGNILSWMDGTMDGFSASDAISRRLGKPWNSVAFRDILNPEWVKRNLDDPGYEDSDVRRVLRENDLHRGWRPTKPILFCHSPADNDISYQGTIRALAFLGAEIQKSGGDPRQLLVVKPIGNLDAGIGHMAGIAFALPVGFDWIYRGMPLE